ncbi:hypothetical protein EC604_22430 [Paenibacillus amylolyticus]|uniref:Uncharacterized protein n=1 Tax=Paenibacillus amylolyticus TaxID=1451 RepID=A0A5M9WYL8_PAEAM|nr:hypothetical protein [Paenibacillus amylolyticus]KAA8786589.1 hypothetical protein EC604_22430 [Paenibacillus amylolyticus]
MRKQMQVYSSVKAIVQDLKKDLELSNESEVIAYMYTIFNSRRKSITLDEHRAALQATRDIINQSTM